MALYEKEIEMNHGHDFVSVLVTEGTEGSDPTAHILFSGRDPTSVTVQLALAADVRALGEAFVAAANAMEGGI